ncbi:major facilitator superfamily domain-containing protein [Globomyces pollinis-pini]|nr:major facilitator superfamily domain-containing protein [Globomyces pollinis-pini]
MATEQSPLLQQHTEILESTPLHKYERLNECINKIGMGDYQWKLFVLCGLGWAADNMWFQAIAVILPKVKEQWNLTGLEIGLGSSLALIGAMIGALLWGYFSDKFGRQPAFVFTLIIAAVGGLAAAVSPNKYCFWVSLTVLGCGIGGNLPVDGALFLEFIPVDNQSLLTLLSAFWPVGQLVASISGWLIIPSQPDDLGWRLLMGFTTVLTVAIVVCRVCIFKFYESPKNLISRGMYREATEIVRILGKKNNVEILIHEDEFLSDEIEDTCCKDYSPMFAPELRLTSILVILIWVLVAVGYNIFNGFITEFLKQNGGVDGNLSDFETYRNYFLVSIFGVPGSIVAMYVTDSNLGRRGTMATATFATAISLFLTTVFRTSFGQLATSCAVSFFQNVMYGVIYSYTPEVFPSFIRGKAVGLASAAGRLAGAFSPILTGKLIEVSVQLPLYISSTLIFTCACAMIFLPIETRGVSAS